MRNWRANQFNQRMPSENELPDFDRKATDFTQNLKQRTAKTSIRDMRYSQRNYGYQQRHKEYGDFTNRFGRDPNENTFSSSNSHMIDRLKFITKRSDNSRMNKQSGMALPVKRKGARNRSRTPKKLEKVKRESDSDSNKPQLGELSEEGKKGLTEDRRPSLIKKHTSASSPKLETQFFSKNVDNGNLLKQIQKKNIEDIMDPNKKKIENLKKFELKMEDNEGNIDELIVKTIPKESNSKKNINAKTFFKEKIENNEGLKFETPAFGKQSTGLFDFEMNVDEINQEDLFFHNKVDTPAESVTRRANRRTGPFRCRHPH